MRVVIIGSGASALSCAIKSKNDKNEVIVLEKNNKSLKKLLLTGNGRCNYFNDNWNSNKYYSYDRDLIDKVINENNKKILTDFYDSIGLIPKIKDCYYYPSSNQAQAVYNSLLKEALNRNVKFIYDYNVNNIKKDDDKYVINNDIKCDILVIATGSKAYPKTGSDGFGYEIAKRFNLVINKVYPALTPIISNNKILKNINGVRSDVLAILYKDNKKIYEEKGEVQFTDYGLSGICIFNLSTFMNENNYKIVLNLLDSNGINESNFDDEFNKLNNKLYKRNITDLLECFLNYKIVNEILKISNISGEKTWNELSNNEKSILKNNLLKLEFNVSGVREYEYSQCCGGGVSLKELNLNNFEVLKNKNLYFIGEVNDITGVCGGYNLSYAFLSGLLAGDDINAKSK